jgi:hypothetical protein
MFRASGGDSQFDDAMRAIGSGHVSSKDALKILTVVLLTQLDLGVGEEPRTRCRFGKIGFRRTLPLTGHSMTLADQAPEPGTTAR